MSATLIVAVIGLAGVLITQWRADQRSEATWDRERDRERERQAREDAARTFDHRRDAYTDFYEAVRGLAFTAYNFGMGLTDEDELSFEWQLPTYRKLQHLKVYATEGVYDAASKAYSVAWRWGDSAKYGQDDDAFYANQVRFDAAETLLLAMIRRDLAIPDE